MGLFSKSKAERVETSTAADDHETLLRLTVKYSDAADQRGVNVRDVTIGEALDFLSER